jgi:hypothetical protein
MEGAGIYAACDGRAEWILIKGICDYADPNRKADKEANQIIAIRSVLDFCEHLFNKDYVFEALGIMSATYIPENVDLYGFKIVNPVQDERLTNPVEISGNFEKAPPAGLFFCIEYNPNIKSYWPKNEIDVDSNSQSWSSVLGLGQGDNKKREILLAAVGAVTKKLIHEFYGSPMNKGWKVLPDDTIIVDRVTITLIPDE